MLLPIDLSGKVREVFIVIEKVRELAFVQPSLSDRLKNFVIKS